jgi:demethylmenaquinone methyltransferase/2-methoxy-6-polyprenyl-1,4-benzoquinol methylase
LENNKEAEGNLMTDQAASFNINRLFSAVAPRYDFLNHLLSLNIDRRWRRELVRWAEVKPGERILDSCTGTGDIAIRFAQLDGSGKVVGVDLSDQMLYLAHRKIRKTRFDDKIRLIKADALNLPFEDNSFDIACIGFGLRNLTDRKRGISEMARILKDGGRLLILEFSPPQNNLFGVCYDLCLNTIIPAVGGIVSGSTSAYRYLSTSIANFLEPKEILKLMEDENLKNLYSKSLTGGIAYIYRGEKR